MTYEKIRHFDAFSGYGGFRLGLERTQERDKSPLQAQDGQCAARVQPARVGVQHRGDSSITGPNDRTPYVCIGFSEVDPHAIAVYKYHWPETKNYGDISKINWSEVPDFDILTGGSPCQDFSIAGKRAGIAGARSGLVWEFIRALEEKKPAHFIWENVRGVMSSRRGWDFANILMAFSEAGYALRWNLLNAKYFGVPQNRERIFVVGTRADLGSPPSVLFETGAGSPNTTDAGREGSHAHSLDATYHKGWLDHGQRTFIDEKPTDTQPK